jgi:hypothetical protein
MMYFCTQLLDWGWLRKLDFSISAPNYVLGMTPLTTLVGRTQHFLVMSRKIVTKILLKLYRTLFYLNYIKTVQSRLVCQSLSPVQSSQGNGALFNIEKPGLSLIGVGFSARA